MTDDRVQIEVPCPPSINHYHGKKSIKPKGGIKHRVLVFVTREGREFLRDVKRCVAAAGYPTFGDAEVAVRIDVHLPSGAGDHHNREKPVLDALQEANVFDDDAQVVDLRVVKQYPVPGGRCTVSIWKR